MKDKLGVILVSACFVIMAFASIEAKEIGKELSVVSRQTIEEYLAKGDNESAQDALLSALASESFPDKKWAILQYYSLATQSQGVTPAIKRLEQEVKKYPNNAGLQLSIAEGYIRIKQWDKVVEIYEKLVKNDPDDTVLANRLRNFYMLQGNYQGVIQSYEPYVQANPDDVEASDILANAYVRAGRVDEAIGLYQKKIEKKPGSAGLRARFAQALMSFGRLDEAAGQWQKAFELDPSNLFFKQKLGETYLALEKYQQAKKEFEDLRRLAPDNQPWFRNIASGQLQVIEDRTKGKKVSQKDGL
jgi:pentatricopeptide repeat protein